ncbi:MAG TPA: hypothetical protein PKH77_19855 [Anaerolineae bacterium]|nr:hypothetical protein [Anaerolineae bacterium]
MAEETRSCAAEYLAVFPGLTYHVEPPTQHAGYDLDYDPGGAWYEFPAEYTLYVCAGS